MGGREEEAVGRQDHRAATTGATAVPNLEARDRSEQLGGYPRDRRRIRVEQLAVVGETLGLLQCVHGNTFLDVITHLHPEGWRYSRPASDQGVTSHRGP